MDLLRRLDSKYGGIFAVDFNDPSSLIFSSYFPTWTISGGLSQIGNINFYTKQSDNDYPKWDSEIAGGRVKFFRNSVKLTGMRNLSEYGGMSSLTFNDIGLGENILNKTLFLTYKIKKSDNLSPIDNPSYQVGYNFNMSTGIPPYGGSTTPDHNIKAEYLPSNPNYSYSSSVITWDTMTFSILFGDPFSPSTYTEDFSFNISADIGQNTGTASISVTNGTITNQNLVVNFQYPNQNIHFEFTYTEDFEDWYIPGYQNYSFVFNLSGSLYWNVASEYQPPNYEYNYQYFEFYSFPFLHDFFDPLISGNYTENFNLTIKLDTGASSYNLINITSSGYPGTNLFNINSNVNFLLDVQYIDITFDYMDASGTIYNAQYHLELPYYRNPRYHLCNFDISVPYKRVHPILWIGTTSSTTLDNFGSGSIVLMKDFVSGIKFGSNLITNYQIDSDNDEEWKIFSIRPVGDETQIELNGFKTTLTSEYSNFGSINIGWVPNGDLNDTSNIKELNVDPLSGATGSITSTMNIGELIIIGDYINNSEYNEIMSYLSYKWRV